MSQRNILLKREANEWYRRNKDRLGIEYRNDPIIRSLESLGIQPKRILEIGCSNGWRLNAIKTIYNEECFGIDPSGEAIREGSKNFSKICLLKGTAENLPFKLSKFDFVVYGFCLYLCDRNDLFRIACEGDRVLADKGTMIIHDFFPSFPYYNEYKHNQDIKVYKMNYGRMFTWNPSYTIIFQKVFHHEGEGENISEPDERVSVVILKKDNSSAYPFNPFIKKAKI